MSKKSGIGKFIAGAAIGVGLGILFAPKSGKETRKALKVKLDELTDQIKKIDVAEVKKEFSRKIEDIKLVITESSLKLLKFADDAINQEKMNDLVSRIWTDIADSKFGVVKHDKKTKFFNGKKVQTTYQLLNTLALS